MQAGFLGQDMMWVMTIETATAGGAEVELEKQAGEELLRAGIKRPEGSRLLLTLLGGFRAPSILLTSAVKASSYIFRNLP